MTDTDARTARLTWVKDDDPRWDADRERVFATVPAGVFRSEIRTPGERLSSDWWRVRDGDRVIGYGWLDDVWGDAEILLAVEADARGSGAGAFALSRLGEEAAERGLNYVVNVVRDTHPDRAAVTAWFLAHGSPAPRTAGCASGSGTRPGTSASGTRGGREPAGRSRRMRRT